MTIKEYLDKNNMSVYDFSIIIEATCETVHNWLNKGYPPRKLKHRKKMDELGINYDKSQEPVFKWHKGSELIFIGTAIEFAEFRWITVQAARRYTIPSHHKVVGRNQIVGYRLEEV